ncbi:MAG: NAD(P)H-dependent oxidoreductase, partial [Nitratireductor sp.]
MRRESALAEDTFPNLDETSFRSIDEETLFTPPRMTHPPRILLLHGSLRERSYSRLANEEAARILRRFGCETRVFDPHG